MCSFRSLTKSVFVLFCMAVMVFAQTAMAGTHVVSPADMQSAMNSAAKTRQAETAQLQQFLQSSLGQQALEAAGVNYAQVEQKVATLSDDELAQLSARSHQLQQDFAAGRLTNTHITYIIIAAVAIVLIIALAAS